MDGYQQFDQWREIICKQLSKKLIGKVANIVADIQAVDIGLKPGFLFDYGLVNEGHLANILQTAHSNGLLTNDSLCVVKVDMDAIIVNPKKLGEHLNLIDNGVEFVDVSEQNSLPKLMDSSNRHKVVPSVIAVQKIFSQMKDFTDFGPVYADIPVQANVSTVYGLLLGYPVIYWYEYTENSDFGRCLSMEPLKNIKVYGETVPVTDTCGCLLKYKKGDHSGHKCSPRSTVPVKCQLIYSFSYPERFTAELAEKVTQWFACVQNSSGSSKLWKFIFRDLTLTEEITCQPSVVL